MCKEKNDSKGKKEINGYSIFNRPGVAGAVL